MHQTNLINHGKAKQNSELKGEKNGSDNYFSSNFIYFFSINYWEHFPWVAKENKGKAQ